MREPETGISNSTDSHAFFLFIAQSGEAISRQNKKYTMGILLVNKCYSESMSENRSMNQSFCMKRFFSVCLVLMLFSQTLFSQKYVACPSCGGTKGHWVYDVFVSCWRCFGEGKIIDPDYASQQARNYGAALATFDMAKINLAHGDFEEAFKGFRKAAFDDGLEAAFFYLGACLELGMGIDVNRDLAKQAYDIGKKLGRSDCINAIARINQNGFWQPTDKKREEFRLMLKNTLENTWKNSSPNIPKTNGENRTRSSGISCSGCGGTGRCTACGGIGKLKSESIYTGGGTIISDCPVCRGNGRCGVCHGKGSL